MSNTAMMMGLSSGAGGTPWLADLSVASYDSVLLAVQDQDTVANGITFGYDGLRMYMTGDGSKYVNQYDLTTAWDLSTASYASKRFYVGSQEGDPSGVQFKSDGTKFYLIGVNTILYTNILCLQLGMYLLQVMIVLALVQILNNLRLKIYFLAQMVINYM